MLNLMARMRGGRMLALPLLVALALLGAGCDAGGGVTHPTATATPSPTPAPKIIYQADWTKDASQWKLAPGWKLTPSGLANDGEGVAPVYIPYTPTVSNYTLEIVLRLDDVYGKSACGNSFGLRGETQTGDAVYFAVIACMDAKWHSFAEVYSATDAQSFPTQDYTPGRSARTYTINVDGPYVTYLLNGAELGTVKCDRPTSPNRLLLLNTNLETVIQRITITTP